MPDTNEIFSKISEQQKIKLFERLAKSKGFLFCKMANDSMFKVKAYKLAKEKHLVCEKIEDFEEPSVFEKIVMNFTDDSDRYFFYSTLTSVAARLWEIDITTSVYKLQRRESYRIKIPPALKTTALLKNSTDGSPFASGTLLDLSSTGCKILLPGIMPVIPGQIVTFDITIAKRPAFSVNGEIRHTQKMIEPTPQQTVGVKFKDVTTLLESKLFSITMELHRDLAK